VLHRVAVDGGGTGVEGGGGLPVMVEPGLELGWSGELGFTIALSFRSCAEAECHFFPRLICV
jgi:hypothetical protein